MDSGNLMPSTTSVETHHLIYFFLGIMQGEDDWQAASIPDKSFHPSGLSIYLPWGTLVKSQKGWGAPLSVPLALDMFSHPTETGECFGEKMLVLSAPPHPFRPPPLTWDILGTRSCKVQTQT